MSDSNQLAGRRPSILSRPNELAPGVGYTLMVPVAVPLGGQFECPLDSFTMHLEIDHVTRYTYDRTVQLLPHLVYLRPRTHPGFDVHRFSLVTKPRAEVQWMRDDFDNLPASVQFHANATEMEIATRCLVSTALVLPFGFLVRDYAASFPFSYEPLHRFNLSPYLQASNEETTRALREWTSRHLTNPPRDTVGWLFALNQRVNGGFVYVRRDEPGIQTPLATIAAGSGSCRDLAGFMIACLRAHGLAARFVSGYLYDAAAHRGGSASMHAWVEIFLPGAGWKGLDPTHGLFCNETYVPVAHAAIAESVNPIQGAFFSSTPAHSEMTTGLRIRPLAEGTERALPASA